MRIGGIESQASVTSLECRRGRIGACGDQSRDVEYVNLPRADRLTGSAVGDR